MHFHLFHSFIHVQSGAAVLSLNHKCRKMRGYVWSTFGCSHLTYEYDFLESILKYTQ